MGEFLVKSSFFGFFISLMFYQFGLVLKKKYPNPIFNPLLIAIILTISLLLIFKIDYSTYNASAKYLSYLLTPATISLAIPLYQQFELLKKNYKAILISITVGVITSLTVILVLCMIFGLTHQEYVTLLPKSITTAIGMAVSENLNGIVSITVASIVLTGVLGNIIATTVLRFFKITNPIAKGVAIGTAAHAIGTSKAIELGEVEGAISGLSIAIAGLLTVAASILFSVLY